ncbi:MAG: CHASE domain-containing protein, partial [Aliarcobacter sp.]|nr:CHASE domain-containing protein [Aliarcobacter sp.]
MNYVYKRIYLLILLVGILSSLIFGYHTYTNNLEKEQIQFNSLTKKVIQQINNRMATYREILYSGVSFFEASHHVSRDEWHIFVNKLQLKELFPGIQGLGYSLVLRENELEKNMQDIQAEGFPNYKIKPEGKRDLYTSIIYLEPFDQRNQRAFGYDMFSEENRRNAMSRSIELGLPSLSNKVRLVQENGKDEQSGFLLYTPHYKKNYPLENKEQRYEAIEGFVYAVFRTKDFIHGAVGDSLEMLDIKMYDGKEKNENSLLLNSNTKTEENKTFNKTVQVELDGHIWTFEITAKDSFLDNQQNIYSLIFTLLGFAITFLIALLVKRQG